MATPNMNITLPVPGLGGTPGPQWASEVNTALSTIDAHDHTSGKGPLVPSAGLGINADLAFNGYDATTLRATRFTSQVANPAQTALVFVKNGELTYIDSLGNVVPITAAGSVAGATGSISGLTAPASAVYSSVSKSFTWLFDSSKAARMANADILLYPYDGSTAFANSITVKAPTALAAAYALTLPLAVPSSDNILSMSASGVLTAGAAAGSAANPSISFASDLDTGFYNIGANSVGLTLGGTQRIDFSIGNLVFKPDGVEAGRFSPAQLQMVSGSAATPPYSFGSDLNSGWYSQGADSVGLSLGGSNRVDFSLNDFVFKPGGSEVGRFVVSQLQMVAGSAAAPSYSFGADANTGIYNVSSDRIGLSSGGTRRLIVDSGGLYWTPSGTEIGGSRIKWRVFSGNLGSGASTTLTCPSDGTAVLGMVGQKIGGGVITYGTAGTLRFETAALGNDTDVALTNGAGVSLDYRVIMYYQ